MNKEEYAIDEKTYENYDGLKIKIIFSNLGRRYKKIGDNLSLMLENRVFLKERILFMLSGFRLRVSPLVTYSFLYIGKELY